MLENASQIFYHSDWHMERTPGVSVSSHNLGLFGDLDSNTIFPPMLCRRSSHKQLIDQLSCPCYMCNQAIQCIWRDIYYATSYGQAGSFRIGVEGAHVVRLPVQVDGHRLRSL